MQSHIILYFPQCYCSSPWAQQSVCGRVIWYQSINSYLLDNLLTPPCQESIGRNLYCVVLSNIKHFLNACVVKPPVCLCCGANFWPWEGRGQPLPLWLGPWEHNHGKYLDGWREMHKGSQREREPQSEAGVLTIWIAFAFSLWSSTGTGLFT